MQWSVVQVTGALDGVITGETLSGNAFWETLLAGSKNVVNMGGNVETEELGAQPLEITIGGYRCQLSEVLYLLTQSPQRSASGQSCHTAACFHMQSHGNRIVCRGWRVNVKAHQDLTALPVALLVVLLVAPLMALLAVQVCLKCFYLEVGYNK